MNIPDVLRYECGGLFWKVSRGPAKAGKQAGSVDKDGYICVGVFGKIRKAHHIVWYLHHGYWPEELDHLDLDKTNNRIENLRESSRYQNSCNQKPRRRNSTGFKGVGVIKGTGKWRAETQGKNRRVYLGSFDSAEDAATAYNFAAAEIHGEFAFFNTVPQPWLDSI